MDDWLQRYAERLGVPPLTDAEVADLLELARDVAHGTERRFAPLSTFLAGVAVATRPDGDRAAVVAEVARHARAMLGRPGDGDGRGEAATP